MRLRPYVPDWWVPSMRWTRRSLEAAKATQLFVYSGWLAWEDPRLGDESPMLASKADGESQEVLITEAWDRESFEGQVDAI